MTHAETSGAENRLRKIDEGWLEDIRHPAET